MLKFLALQRNQLLHWAWVSTSSRLFLFQLIDSARKSQVFFGFCLKLEFILYWQLLVVQWFYCGVLGREGVGIGWLVQFCDTFKGSLLCLYAKSLLYFLIQQLNAVLSASHKTIPFGLRQGFIQISLDCHERLCLVEVVSFVHAIGLFQNVMCVINLDLAI